MVCLSGMSCKQLIYDDLSDCPQYLAVRLVAPKDCVPFSSDTDFGKVEVCTYELDGSLVDRTFLDKLPEYGDSTIMVTVPKPASYRIVVKASKDLSDYTNSEIESERKNVLSHSKDTVKTELNRLIFGTNVIKKEYLTNDGTTVDTVHVQMRTMTNKFNLTFTGLHEDVDYVAEIKAANRAYDNTGSSTKTTAVYQRDLKRSGELNVGIIDILALSRDLPHPTLSLKDKKTGESIAEFNLISLLDQIAEEEKKTYDFECRHSYDITIRLNLDPYMKVTATILPWEVIIRDVILKGF